MKSFAYILVFSFYSFFIYAQNKIDFIGRSKPKSNAQIRDVSSDDRYLLMSSYQGSNLYIYDLYSETSRAITFEGVNYETLVQAKFENSHNKIILSFEDWPKPQLFIEIQLDPTTKTISSREIHLPGRNKNLEYTIKTFAEVLIFEGRLENKPEIAQLIALDNKSFAPIDNINSMAGRAIKNNGNVDYCVDDSSNSFFLLYKTTTNSLLTKVDKIQKTSAGWKAVNKELQLPVSFTRPKKSKNKINLQTEYFLSANNKGIISFSNLFSTESNSNNKSQNKTQVSYFNFGTGYTKISSFDKNNHKNLHKYIDSLGGLNINIVRQDYLYHNHGNIELESYLMTDSVRILKNNSIRVIQSKEEFLFHDDSESFLSGYSRGQNVGVLQKHLLNSNSYLNYYINYKKNEIVPLNFFGTNTDTNGYSEDQFETFSSYNLIKNTPFDLITHKATGAIIHPQEGKYSCNAISRNFSFNANTLFIDSVGLNCATKELIIYDKAVLFRIGLSELLKKLNEQTSIKSVGLFTENSHLFVQYFKYPIIQLSIFDNVSRKDCVFFYDIANFKIKDYYIFKLKEDQAYNPVFSYPDSVGVFYDLTQYSQHSNVKDRNVLKLYKFDFSGKINFIDSVAIDYKLDSSDLSYGTSKFYPKYNVFICFLREFENSIIVYDIKDRKLIKKFRAFNDVDIYSSKCRKTILDLLRYFSTKLDSTASVNFDVLGNIFGPSFKNRNAFLVSSKQQELTVIGNYQILNLSYKGDSISIIDQITFTGLSKEVDFEKNLFISYKSVDDFDQDFNVYRIKPARALFSVHFDNETAVFESADGLQASFYSLQSQEKSLNDAYLNRPDTILSLIGNVSDNLHFVYNRVVALRQLKAVKYLNKLFDPGKLTSTNLHLPSIQIVNDNHLKKIYQTINEIKLIFTAVDNIYDIEGYSIWVNDVPFYSTMGLKASQVNILTKDILLSTGQNCVTIAVYNSKGVWSEKAKYVCYFIPESPSKNKLYFFGVGMSQYYDSSRNLCASKKDIINVAEVLKGKEFESKSVDTILLINEKANLKMRFRMLKDKLLKTNINDEVILMLSGHGLLSDSNLIWNFASYQTDFSHPDTSISITYDDINWLFDSIPARNRLIIIDACHAGQSYFEYAKDIITDTQSFPDSGQRPKGDPEDFKNMPFLMLQKLSNFKPAKSFAQIDYEAFKIITSTFPEFNQNGSVIITASRGEQTASEDCENGKFTKGLLEIFKHYNNHTLSINTLITEINRQFPDLGEQKPSIKAFNPSNDWLIW